MGEDRAPGERGEQGGGLRTHAPRTSRSGRHAAARGRARPPRRWRQPPGALPGVTLPTAAATAPAVRASSAGARERGRRRRARRLVGVGWPAAARGGRACSPPPPPPASEKKHRHRHSKRGGGPALPAASPSLAPPAPTRRAPRFWPPGQRLFSGGAARPSQHRRPDPTRARARGTRALAVFQRNKSNGVVSTTMDCRPPAQTSIARSPSSAQRRCGLPWHNSPRPPRRNAHDACSVPRSPQRKRGGEGKTACPS